MSEGSHRVLDDMLDNPRFVRDARFKLWERSLDSFLSEMRSMINYSEEPGQYSVDILELLIFRLSRLRISERLEEQRIVRFTLEDVIKNLFTVSRLQKRRMAGC